ncbi:probable low-specificity L-threonine aldolase 2 [Plutella xylostella]|uniref:probable low-specificity L-threonine aldolase 2 n=1 Tax=Plutella xylostella TaxID=51655 RepID=UPI0020327FF6|nr:probable low-specificity L-threonine aldolase 2 [Plutella xylostella]
MTNEAMVIDLRSDTVTKPTDSMRKAIEAAEVGDDVYGEDPTVNKLQDTVAQMLGKEAALFVPSGTMANLIAIMVHCHKRGAEMLCGDQSHIFKRETGGAHLTGVQLTPLKNLPDGTFDLDDLEKHVRGSDIHEPVTMMVAVENTHSYCGGKVLPLAWIDKLAAIAKKRSLMLHMDGARLFNASEHLKEDPSRVVRDCDSVSVCFSKGLGAPVGTVLAGTKGFIEQARRMRKMLGGGMRQAGLLAAAALVALDESLPSLYSDHRRAQYLAKSIKDLKLKSFSVDVENQHTNIIHVMINEKSTVTSKKLVERLLIVSQSETNKDCKTADSKGIVVKASSKPNDKTLRFVLHHDVNDDKLRLAVKKITFVLKEVESNG